MIRCYNMYFYKYKKPRIGWKKDFQQMAEKDDALLIPDAILHTWVEEEWQW